MWLKGEGKIIVSPFRNQKGLGIFDTLLVCIFVSVLIGMVIPYYQTLAQNAREVALKTGLANIRKGIELYQALQGHNPPDLKKMVRTRYIIATREDTFFSGEYLRAQAEDGEGDLIDPFGNRYRYDPKDGSVTSGTKEYEKW
jgi:competence protein ComGC